MLYLAWRVMGTTASPVSHPQNASQLRKICTYVVGTRPRHSPEPTWVSSGIIRMDVALALGCSTSIGSCRWVILRIWVYDTSITSMIYTYLSTPYLAYLYIVTWYNRVFLRASAVAPSAEPPVSADEWSACVPRALLVLYHSVLPP
ncbi:hypothetical protein F4802DRAFT_8006 [Xylaria palmicola]|nr:hypothetical protein F4802DRAFT_8006 [Xylaria palmicola]